MFTGIVESQDPVRSITDEEVPRLVVAKPKSWKFKIGASIAVDGVCLTVVSQTADSFSVDVVQETLDRTTIKNFTAGRMVNLERPLRIGDEIGGHIVQGHVDTEVAVVDIKRQGTSCEISLAIPAKYERSVVEKGSIAVNGVSLTVARIEGKILTIALIPHTLQQTNLGGLQVGDKVNIEFDASRLLLDLYQKK